METNRIDLAFTLAGKSNQTKSTSGANGNAFADMLFGAMGPKVGEFGADKLQIKPAETYAPRRRFDDYTPQQFDSRTGASNHADRRADAVQSRARSNGEDVSTNAGRLSQASTERGVPHARAVQAPHTANSDPSDPTEVGADGAVDAASDVDTAGRAPDMSIGGDDCGKQDSGDNADGTETPLITATVQPPLAEELPETADLELTAVAAGTATAGAADAAAPDETPEALAAAAALAATATLPEGTGASDGTEGVATSVGDDTTDKTAGNAAKGGVTFAAALTLNDAPDEATAVAENQVNAMNARNEQQIEDAGSSFRRNAANGRRNQGNGAGTAGAQANTGHQATAAMTAATAEARANSSAQTTTPLASGTAPVGLDTGLGGTAGLSGWNLHAAQGSALRRGEFVANLRQHLQNLPAHEQVALSIQRSLRDGGGNITLQLSPAELGRIHLKLKIDEENNVQASVMVERPATLELLQRDMKALERALQEAGLKAGPGDLSFSLQGGDPDAFAREFGSGNGNGSSGSGQANGAEGAEDVPAAIAAPVVDTADGWVDVQV